MKVTKRQLRKIIREERENLSEMMDDDNLDNPRGIKPEGERYADYYGSVNDLIMKKASAAGRGSAEVHLAIRALENLVKDLKRRF